MFKLLVCKVIFNATNCAQQKGEPTSLYNSACRYLHFCHGSFGHLSAHLQVKVLFLQGNIDFWASLYQLTAYCTFLSTCLQDCGEFEVDTYTRISCAGCLCLAASSHREIWVQSSFSLWRNTGRELCMTGQTAVTTPTTNNTHKSVWEIWALPYWIFWESVAYPRRQFWETVWKTASIPLIEMSCLWQDEKLICLRCRKNLELSSLLHWGAESLTELN